MPAFVAPAVASPVDADGAHNAPALAILQLVGGYWLRHSALLAPGTDPMVAYRRGALDPVNLRGFSAGAGASDGPRFRNSQKKEPRARFWMSISNLAAFPESSPFFPALGMPYRVEQILFSSYTADPQPATVDAALRVGGTKLWAGTYEPLVVAGRRFAVSLIVPSGRVLSLDCAGWRVVSLACSAEHECEVSP